MRGLREDHDLVERVYTKPWEKFQPQSQPNSAQQVHHFLEGNRPRKPQQTVRPPDFVLDDGAGVTKQYVSCLLLVLDHLLDNLLEVVHEVLFGLPESRLIGDLKEVPDHLGTLAVQTAEGQPDLRDSLQDLSDLLREDQRRAGGREPMRAGRFPTFVGQEVR
jgi:hypothetical protein